MKVTASISTRNRYFTTLPLCLTALANQTRVPDELIIFDDGDHKDLREEPVYQSIFAHLTKRKIDWRVEFGEGIGQVANHQKTIEIAKYDYIWRMDDDNVPESNVLETLINEIGKAGAIGGLVLDPKGNLHPNKLASSKIEDIFFGLNEQWFPHEKPTIKSVDHLYSSFLYTRKAATHGYEKNLSRVGHREETHFTYGMKRQGWKVLITPHCVTWHYHSPTGGIRDNTRAEMWEKDEELFLKKMKEWEVERNEFFPIVLDNGLGDHYAFKTILPDIIEKNKNKTILLANCYPKLFYEFTNKVDLLSIAEASMSFGSLDRFNLYKFMVDNKCDGHIIDAYKKMYNV